MFQSVTAFLEAIDERVEKHARQQAGDAETNAIKKENLNNSNNGGTDEVNSVEGMLYATGSDPSSHAAGKMFSQLQFPSQPRVVRNQRTDSHEQPGKNDRKISATKEATVMAPQVAQGDEAENEKPTLVKDGSISLQGRWNHVEEGAAAATALLTARDAESALLKRKEEEVKALAQDVRRHQATAEASRQELLQRSLQVHELEESLRAVRARFEEHKAKSRSLLEEKRREYDALRRRLELQGQGQISDENGKSSAHYNSEGAVALQREQELGGLVASLRRENEQLKARVEASNREVDAAREERLGVLQQMDCMRLDLRGVQEALESEISAHQRSRALLQGRQRELNELRAAVEKNGGSFTTSGALVTLRGDDAGSRENMLFSRQLLEKQNALEAAIRDAAEWRRRCEQATHRLEEERATRVHVTPSQQMTRDGADVPSVFRRRTLSSSGKLMSLVVDLITSVDASVIRIGRTLRRQPLLRITVAFYIICLHIWFLTVILMMEKSAKLSPVAESPL